MKLKAYKVGDLTCFCNEDQIKEAGSLKAAAEKMAEGHKPMKKMKPKEVKKVVKNGEKPTE